MKAVVVYPGKPNSVHLRQAPKPSLASIPDGRVGMQDMTTDDVYLERGINLRHGFLADVIKLFVKVSEGP